MVSLKIREADNTERERDNAGKGKQPEGGGLDQLPDAATVRHYECGNDLLDHSEVCVGQHFLPPSDSGSSRHLLT